MKLPAHLPEDTSGYPQCRAVDDDDLSEQFRKGHEVQSQLAIRRCKGAVRVVSRKPEAFACTSGMP
ncbi:hypothetical protein MTO96_044604, partial [Rhipicephalus appendiculatus]